MQAVGTSRPGSGEGGNCSLGLAEAAKSCESGRGATAGVARKWAERTSTESEWMQTRWDGRRGGGRGEAGFIRGSERTDLNAGHDLLSRSQVGTWSAARGVDDGSACWRLGTHTEQEE